MTTRAPKSEVVLPPEGTHIARCYRFIHIGTVEENYDGESNIVNKVMLSFELPEELHVFKEGEDPKPFVISMEYTLSMNEKANLRKLITGMKGKLSQEEADLFDVEGLVGTTCLITIIYKTAKTSGKVRAEIASASPLMKGQEPKPALNKELVLSYDAWNEEVFQALPKFLKEKMQKTPEYLRMKGIAEVPF